MAQQAYMRQPGPGELLEAEAPNISSSLFSATKDQHGIVHNHRTVEVAWGWLLAPCIYECPGVFSRVIRVHLVHVGSCVIALKRCVNIVNDAKWL